MIFVLGAAHQSQDHRARLVSPGEGGLLLSGGRLLLFVPAATPRARMWRQVLHLLAFALALPFHFNLIL
jgi:hypothetical protein